MGQAVVSATAARLTRATRLWDAEEIAWGRECLAAGDSIEEIAEAAGCAEAEVIANIGPGRLNALQREVVSLYVAGAAFPEIDAELGLGDRSKLGKCAASMITSLRSRGVSIPHRKGSASTEKWSDSRVTQLKKLWLQGVPVREIVRRLGDDLTLGAVVGKAARVGLPTRRQSSEWTDDRVAVLRKRWLEGASGREIADELACGLNAAAVIGKVFRLGLSRSRRAA